MDQLPSLTSGARVMLGDEIPTSCSSRRSWTAPFPPDERLNAGELARRFDVSPTPVREALARLEADRLVEKHALKGYRTTDLLAEKELIELFELRLLLEPGSAARAAERRNAADSADLLSEIEHAHDAVGKPDAYAVLAQHDVRLP